MHRIVEEINYCRKKMNVTYYGFSHDMLTLDKKYINSLCETLIDYYKRSKMKSTWSCSARTDCVTKYMLNVMWKSGCRAIFFGIESGSEKIQKIINKNLNLTDAVKKVNYATNLGMKVIVSYMAGFHDETDEDIDKTLRSVLRMAITGAEPQMTLLSILPGTSLYQQFIDKLEYDGKSFGISGSSMTEPVTDLVKTNRRLFSSFYFLPNEHLEREDLLFISYLVNLLIHFLPTIRSVREYLESDITNFLFHDFIKKFRLTHSETGSLTEQGLYFLTNAFKQYLEYLSFRGLKEYIPDLFQADFTKAYMQVKYNKWQYIRASGNQLPKISSVYSMDDRLKIIPVWKIISTRFNIQHFANNHLDILGKPRLKRGNYNYLVLPVSEKYCKLLRVPGKYLHILKSLKDMEIKDFIYNCEPVMVKNRALKMLKRLVKLGMIEIHCKK